MRTAILSALMLVVVACAPETTEVGPSGYIPSGNLEAVYRQQPVSEPYVSPPPDMAASPPDMSTPPDLAPLPPTVVEVVLGGWALSGPLSSATDSDGKTTYHCTGTWDFVRSQPVLCVVEAMLHLPPEAARAKRVEVSAYSLDATLAWGPGAPTVCSYASDQLIYEKGTTRICIHPSWDAGLAVDGVALSSIRNGIPPTIAARPQVGNTYPISASSSTTLRLELLGNVDVADLIGSATATLWW